jgi:hypothetical protein
MYSVETKNVYFTKRYKGMIWCQAPPFMLVSFEKLVPILGGARAGCAPWSRPCIVPAEITKPPKISGGQNHKYDRLVE